MCWNVPLRAGERACPRRPEHWGLPGHSIFAFLRCLWVVPLRVTVLANFYHRDKISETNGLEGKKD